MNKTIPFCMYMKYSTEVRICCTIYTIDKCFFIVYEGHIPNPMEMSF